ncbi:MAG: PLP-dependent aminotransferase family protein [Thermoanaerobaculia bacterium]
MTSAPPGVLPVLAIDRESDTPLYRQIYEGYREAILDGRLKAGERLPSTRSLAEELGVSRFPVLNAFDQLLAEGYCESRVGAGTFVAATLPEDLGLPGRPAEGPDVRPPPGPRPRAGGPAASLTPVPFARGGSTAFSVGGVAREHFPFRTFATLVSRHARSLDAGRVHYGPALGVLSFREAICDYLRTARGVRCEPRQVIVTSGSQQALDFCARVLLEPGSGVWVEDPGYWGAQDILRVGGARLVPVPVDGSGLDVAAGIERAPTARAVFVTPSHQFPLGVTMSASRRLHLLEWARQSGAWILEDDYNSEYRYESQPIASLQGLDRDARVLYIGTFSKVLAPALRLGYMVVPEDLAPSFSAARHVIDISPPTFLQHVMADFLREGHFGRHLRRMRKLYRERRSALVRALESALGDDVEILGEQAGLHLVVTLPPGTDDRAISERARDEELHVLSLSSCYLEGGRPGLVLGYGGVSVEEMPEAARRLARLL